MTKKLRNDFRGEVWHNMHPKILKELMDMNELEVDGGYSDESSARRATELMQSYFKKKIYTSFTFNGTGANVFALRLMLKPWSTLICAKQAHVNNYECGSFESLVGCKILSCESEDGKLTPKMVSQLLLDVKNYKYHPSAISITQPTEFGTVYTIDELKELCDFAHKNNMYVYMDGARIGNAVAALNTDFGSMIEDTGVDAFSFGGTKAGAAFGEMLVFFHEEFAKNITYMQKQILQHMPKSKFLSCQIAILLQENIWLDDARRSNESAALLEAGLRKKNIPIVFERQTNMVFVKITPEQLERLTRVFDLHYWNYTLHTLRLAVTCHTTKEQIDELLALL